MSFHFKLYLFEQCALVQFSFAQIHTIICAKRSQPILLVFIFFLGVKILNCIAELWLIKLPPKMSILWTPPEKLNYHSFIHKLWSIFVALSLLSSLFGILHFIDSVYSTFQKAELIWFTAHETYARKKSAIFFLGIQIWYKHCDLKVRLFFVSWNMAPELGVPILYTFGQKSSFLQKFLVNDEFNTKNRLDCLFFDATWKKIKD